MLIGFCPDPHVSLYSDKYIAHMQMLPLMEEN